MRIGFDIDGVLADFVPAYQKLHVDVTGRDTFLPGDNVDPPIWDWPELRGYTRKETSDVWGRIGPDPTFWLNLAPMSNVGTLRKIIKHLERTHEVYFITSRSGNRVKRQTEIWLFEHLGYPLNCPGVWPTVLIVGSNEKGAMCKALKLDLYIDDNWDNVVDCAKTAPKTRTFLLNRKYNMDVSYAVADSEAVSHIVRVTTLGQMFDAAIERL